MPAYDARAIQGIGITYATSNRGGLPCPWLHDLSRSSGSAPAAGSYRYQRKGSLGQDLPGSDSCHRLHGALSVYLLRHGAKEYTDLLNAATGTNWTIEQVLEIGDRIYNIERMFNKAAGMKPEDDRLPKRLLEEPVVNGPSTGMTSKLPLTLPEYYEARGWVNAFPTDETLKKLGLDECVGK